MMNKEEIKIEDIEINDLKFIKIPKTQYGRCIECHANKICGVKFKCTNTMDQQYQLVNIKTNE